MGFAAAPCLWRGGPEPGKGFTVQLAVFPGKVRHVVITAQLGALGDGVFPCPIQIPRMLAADAVDVFHRGVAGQLFKGMAELGGLSCAILHRSAIVILSGICW